jgi:adenosylcobinamide-phosphate synthase
VRSGRVWEWAGKFAARADDLLSWIPARITALLLALAALRWPHGLAHEARRTPSPNSGWPMAAMALLLNVRLGKPDFYVLHREGRQVKPDDVRRALRLGGRAVALAGALASAALLGQELNL